MDLDWLMVPLLAFAIFGSIALMSWSSAWETVELAKIEASEVVCVNQ